MNELLTMLGEPSLSGFWLPVLIWTVLAGAALFVTRRMALSPTTQHGLAFALLLALPLTFALQPLVPAWSVPVALSDAIAPSPADAPTTLAPTMPMPSSVSTQTDGQARGTAWDWAWLLVLCNGVLLLLASSRLGGLLQQGLAVRQLRGALAHPAATHQTYLNALAAQLGLRRTVALRVVKEGQVPMTFGWRHPVVAVPASLLNDPAALHPILVHELVHVKRQDYLSGWVIQLIHAAFGFHPLVGVLRRKAEYARELACDAEVLHATDLPKRTYAELLYRLHPQSAAINAALIGIVSPTSTLKKRIQAMKTINLTPKKSRWTMVWLTSLVLLPALLTACTTKPTEPTDHFFSTFEVDAAQEAELLHEIQRLEIQVDYLKSQYDALIGEMTLLQEKMQRAGNSASFHRHYELLRPRMELLNNMYMERMERLEYLKLEQITQERMGGLSARDLPQKDAVDVQQDEFVLVGKPLAQTQDQPFITIDSIAVGVYTGR